MGTDINGWVEVRIDLGTKPPYDSVWRGVLKVDSLVGRNYDMFSCLFGIMPFAPFRPIAHQRNLPLDLSEQVSDDYLNWGEVFGETWVAWSEIAAIDWSEHALDSRPHEYERDTTGELVYIGKAVPRTSEIFEEGRTWQAGAITYRVERITRREALSRDWALLFRLMKTLAEDFGDDQVRLVVWFDR